MASAADRANNARIVENLEKMTGKSFSQIVDDMNERFEQKMKERRNNVSKAMMFTISSSITKTTTGRRCSGCGTCRCGATHKRVLIDEKFFVVCSRTNKAPKNCW